MRSRGVRLSTRRRQTDRLYRSACPPFACGKQVQHYPVAHSEAHTSRFNAEAQSFSA
jgi:hypothetical protein